MAQLEFNGLKQVFKAVLPPNPIPEWQNEHILRKYFEVYSWLWPDVPEYRFLDSKWRNVLAALIYGDTDYIVKSALQAEQFKNCGNEKIYSYLLDVESQYDSMFDGPPPFPGTGHGGEQDYVWGTPQLGTYPEFNGGLEPLDWEFSTSFLFQALEFSKGCVTIRVQNSD